MTYIWHLCLNKQFNQQKRLSMRAVYTGSRVCPMYAFCHKANIFICSILNSSNLYICSKFNSYLRVKVIQHNVRDSSALTLSPWGNWTCQQSLQVQGNIFLAWKCCSSLCHAFGVCWLTIIKLKWNAMLHSHGTAFLNKPDPVSYVLFAIIFKQSRFKLKWSYGLLELPS